MSAPQGGHRSRPPALNKTKQNPTKQNTPSSPNALPLPQPQLEIRRVDPRPDQTAKHLRLAVQMRHLPQPVQHPRHVPPAEAEVLRRVEPEGDGAVGGVEVADRGEAAALGARLRGEDADAGEDGHFGRAVREGRGLAAEDLHVGVLGEVSGDGGDGPGADEGVVHSVG